MRCGDLQCGAVPNRDYKNDRPFQLIENALLFHLKHLTETAKNMKNIKEFKEFEKS